MVLAAAAAPPPPLPPPPLCNTEIYDFAVTHQVANF